MKLKMFICSVVVANSLLAATTNIDNYLLTNEAISTVKEALKEFENVKTIDDLKKLQNSENLHKEVSKSVTDTSIKETSADISENEIKKMSEGIGFENDTALKGIDLNANENTLKALAEGKGFENDTSLKGVNIDMSDEAIKRLADSFTGNVTEIASGKIDEATPDEIAKMFKDTEVTEADKKRYEEAVAAISDEEIQAVADNTLANQEKFGSFKFNKKSKDDLLSGLPKLACEAILCLASGTGIPACSPSLSHYFGIKVFNRHGLNWAATIHKRLLFLLMCPKENTMSAENAANMESLLKTLSHMEGKCDKDTLNSYLEYSHQRKGSQTTSVGSVIPDKDLNMNGTYDCRYKDEDGRSKFGKCSLQSTFVRIKPYKPHYCNSLGNHAFGLDIRDVKYTCNPKEYYLKTDWDKGYYFKEVSKEEFDSLPANLKAYPRNSWTFEDGCKCPPEAEKCRAKPCYAPATFTGDRIKTGSGQYSAMERPIRINTDKHPYRGVYEKDWKIVTTKHYKKVPIRKDCWQYVRSK